jgi:hypothetical protein
LGVHILRLLLLLSFFRLLLFYYFEIFLVAHSPARSG